MMITILNGNDADRSPDFDAGLGRIESCLSANHQVDRLDLKSMNIHPCRGCFGCWLKTPGQCLVPDDMKQIYQRYIRSDLVLLASPLSMGFTSWILKKAVERLIPLVHPYVELHQGKFRHAPRYETYPNLGLLLAEEPDTDDDDMAILLDLYRRLGETFHARLVFSGFIGRKSPEEVSHEIGGC